MPTYAVGIACFGSALFSSPTQEDAMKKARQIPMSQIQWSDERAVTCSRMMDLEETGEIRQKLRHLKAMPDAGAHMDKTMAAIRRQAYPDTSGIGKKLIRLYEQAASTSDFADLFLAITGLTWEEYLSQSEAAAGHTRGKTTI